MTITSLAAVTSFIQHARGNGSKDKGLFSYLGRPFVKMSEKPKSLIGNESSSARSGSQASGKSDVQTQWNQERRHGESNVV